MNLLNKFLYNFVLFFTVLSSIVYCYQCRLVQADDGTIYDLSFILSNQPFFISTGSYVYNITICSDANSCAIEQTQNSNSYVYKTCFGVFKLIRAFSRSKGIEVQYENGDFCINCSPSGLRQAYLNIICKQEQQGYALQNFVFTMSQNPVLYINATSQYSCGITPNFFPFTPEMIVAIIVGIASAVFSSVLVCITSICVMKRASKKFNTILIEKDPDTSNRIEEKQTLLDTN